MRDPNRIPEIMCALSAYWMKNPDLRLAQIVSNAHDKYRARKKMPPFTHNRDVFAFEDDDLLAIIYEENQENQ